MREISLLWRRSQATPKRVPEARVVDWHAVRGLFFQTTNHVDIVEVRMTRERSVRWEQMRGSWQTYSLLQLLPQDKL